MKNKNENIRNDENHDSRIKIKLSVAARSYQRQQQ